MADRYPADHKFASWPRFLRHCLVGGTHSATSDLESEVRNGQAWQAAHGAARGYFEGTDLDDILAGIRRATTIFNRIIELLQTIGWTLFQWILAAIATLSTAAFLLWLTGVSATLAGLAANPAAAAAAAAGGLGVGQQVYQAIRVLRAEPEVVGEVRHAAEGVGAAFNAAHRVGDEGEMNRLEQQLTREFHDIFCRRALAGLANTEELLHRLQEKAAERARLGEAGIVNEMLRDRNED